MQSRAAETIKIGIPKVTVMAPLWLADEKGRFAAENLQPRFIDFDAPSLANLERSFIDFKLVTTPPDMSKLYTESFLPL